MALPPLTNPCPAPCPLPPKTLLVLDTVVKREKRKIVVVLGKKEEFGTN